MGKTAFAINIAENAAVRDGKTVGVFSLEMSRESLLLRLLTASRFLSLRFGAVPLRWQIFGLPQNPEGQLDAASCRINCLSFRRALCNCDFDVPSAMPSMSAIS